MRVYSRRFLREFWEGHADAETPLAAWYKDADSSVWGSFADIRATHASASHLENERVCFNIKGNTYRLIVAVDYIRGVVLIKWVGTHFEYMKIDADTVGGF